MAQVYFIIIIYILEITVGNRIFSTLSSSILYVPASQVIRALGGVNGEKRRGGLHLARPKSPNMQELKRRFRQVLSSKVKSATTLWWQNRGEQNITRFVPWQGRPWKEEVLPSERLETYGRRLHREDLWLFMLGNPAIGGLKRPVCRDQSILKGSQAAGMRWTVKTEWSTGSEAQQLPCSLDKLIGRHDLIPGNRNAALGETSKTAKQTAHLVWET